MDKIAIDFIHQHKLRIGKDVKLQDVCAVICKHMETLVHNVASLAAIVVTMYESKKLDMIHVPAIQKFVLKQCQKKVGATMHGGRTVMASDFFGYPHPNYSPSNGGEDILPIDLANGTTARPAMGPMSGGNHKPFSVAHSKVVKAVVKSVLDRHSIKYTTEVMNALFDIMDSQLACLASDLQKCEPLSIKKLESLMKKKRYFAFQ